jgi:hypothetical protein
MIVRIATEGQYRVGSDTLDKLNAIDNQLVNIVARGDQAAYDQLLKSMLDLVRQSGQPVALTEIVESDLVLPAPDTTLAEARQLFKGDGLIPD